MFVKIEHDSMFPEDILQYLIEAISNGDQKAVIALLGKDPSLVHSIDADSSFTPLQWAVLCAKFGIVELLVQEYEADVNYHSTSMPSSLTIALEQLKNIKDKKVLNKKTSEKEECEWLNHEEQDYLKIVLFLIQSGASNTPGDYGITPLYYAIDNGLLEPAFKLIEMGEHLHTPTKWGATAIQVALERGHRELFNLLVQNQQQQYDSHDEFGHHEFLILNQFSLHMPQSLPSPEKSPPQACSSVEVGHKKGSRGF